MVQRTRARCDRIAGAPASLEAMGKGRQRIIRTSTGVRPVGTVYHALPMVTTASDTLAFFMTGQQHLYAIVGSTPASAPPMLVAPGA